MGVAWHQKNWDSVKQFANQKNCYKSCTVYLNARYFISVMIFEINTNTVRGLSAEPVKWSVANEKNLV